MTTVVLVRHATTAATGSRLGGWTPEVHLDEAGRAQAAATAERLARLPVAAVYASPLERTVETATAIASAHGLTVTIDDGIGEVDYGDWTDRPLDDLRREPLWPVIQATPSRVTFPGGGTIRGAQARAVDTVERIARDHRSEVVVAVSHADVIKAVVAHLIGQPLDAFQRLVISPASATVVQLEPGMAPILLRLNDTGPVDIPTPSPADPTSTDGASTAADDAASVPRP